MRKQILWVVVFTGFLVACGAELPGADTGSGDGAALASGPCQPNSSASCACGITPGVKLCRADLTWSACLCDTVAGAGGVGGALPQGGAGGALPQGGVGGALPQGGVGGALPQGGVGGALPQGGTGGMAGMSGMAGMGGMAGGDPPPVTMGEPKIPAAPASCPQLKTGTVQVLGQNVQMWVGSKQADKKGAVFFYWHGTGSNSGEASGGLGSAIQEITGEGGVVASFTTSTAKGQNTGNNVWYTGDFEMADIILACAIQQLNIDTHRIYTGGCSAGGLQAGAMAYGRSGYLAGAMPNSGGSLVTTLQDPSHVPAVITAHGKMGSDVVVIDFATTSNSLCTGIANKGGFAVDCDHGGGHCASPSALKTAQWQFLKAHPFGVTPLPYEGGLPASFPSYCKVF